MTIGITGASGQLGRKIVEHLKNIVAADEIVALTRTPENVADLGVTTRVADFENPKGLVGVFAGLDRLLIISTDVVGQRVKGHSAAIDAAKAAGVGHVFYTSIVKADEDSLGFALADEHRATEALLQESGLQFTALRNTFYAENALQSATGAVAQSALLSNSGRGGTAYLSREEIAEATARALASTETPGAIVNLTGPKAYTSADIARAASEVIGNQIAVTEVDDATYTGILETVGLDEGTAAFVTSIGVATRAGALDTVTDDAARYLDRPAQTLEEYFLANKDAFDVA